MRRVDLNKISTLLAMPWFASASTLGRPILSRMLGQLAQSNEVSGAEAL